LAGNHRWARPSANRIVKDARPFHWSHRRPACGPLAPNSSHAAEQSRLGEHSFALGHSARFRSLHRNRHSNNSRCSPRLALSFKFTRLLLVPKSAHVPGNLRRTSPVPLLASTARLFSFSASARAGAGDSLAAHVFWAHSPPGKKVKKAVPSSPEFPASTNPFRLRVPTNRRATADERVGRRNKTSAGIPGGVAVMSNIETSNRNWPTKVGQKKPNPFIGGLNRPAFLTFAKILCRPAWPQ